MLDMPDDYYSRFDPANGYDEHLFVAGRGLQSAELNEMQKASKFRLRQIGDALFKDGDIIRDASCILNGATASCQSGAIYIGGVVRGVAPASFTVPILGAVTIGVRLVDSVVTSTEDPDIRDPATGTRNFDKDGAERLLVVATWGWDGDLGVGDFYPVYSVTDGYLAARELPPQLNSVTQALAGYDRDSAGGSYVVSGLSVTQLPDVDGAQVYSIAEGRARVYGYPVELQTARRVVYPAAAGLRSVVNEPRTSITASAQRVDTARSPINEIQSVSITAQRTVPVVHGVVTGAVDPLPDESVLSLVSVVQGGTTYVVTTDFLLTGNSIDWSPAGAEPAPGSTYTVEYRYIKSETPTAVDATGFTVTGAVVGTLILSTYTFKLPRIDRLCLNTDGQPVWVNGVAATFNPQAPSIPSDLLPLASIYQTWTASRRVVADGIRVISMPDLAKMDSRMDFLAYLIAQQRLESSVHTRESGVKRGLFVEPFIDNSNRDAGQAQDAVVVSGLLMLPIVATVLPLTTVTAPQTLAITHVTALEQSLKTGSMKINPYLAFDLEPALIVLTPSVDRWTEVVESWAESSTSRFVVGAGDLSSVSSQTRTALLNSSTTAIENLRAISIAFTAAGFGAGEVLSQVLFDGLNVTPVGVTANGSGVVTGSFTIPAGVPAGTKAVVFNGAGGASGRASFSGQGTLERRTLQEQTTITELLWQSPPPPPAVIPWTVRIDPVAQTFTLDSVTQITGVELWFSAAPTTNVIVQIRETTVGFPNQRVLAESRLAPGAITVGGAMTRFLFGSPVSLLGGAEYAVVVMCNDANGEVSMAELGKFDATAQRWITAQAYNVGVMLSSSNASTWTVHQDRDLAFRILSANYTATTRTVALGTVAVTAATDLLLMSFADLPTPAVSVNYSLTLPDSSVLTVADGQPVQLPAAITGNISVSANLAGSAAFSPVLHPSAQLVAGVLDTSAIYITRAIPAGSVSSTLKAVFEALVPSGANVVAEYRPSSGGAWVLVPVTATVAVGSGYVEFTCSVNSVNQSAINIRLTLTGTSAARPFVRDLRVSVI